MTKNGINELEKKQARLVSEIMELALRVTYNTAHDVLIYYHGQTNVLDVTIYKTGWREDHENKLVVNIRLLSDKQIHYFKYKDIICEMAYFAIRELEFLKEFLKNVLKTGRVDEEYWKKALSDIEREYYEIGSFDKYIVI